jgi:hypothetical protein
VLVLAAVWAEALTPVFRPIEPPSPSRYLQLKASESHISIAFVHIT